MPESSSFCLLNMVANNGYGRLLSWDLECSAALVHVHRYLLEGWVEECMMVELLAWSN
jgi:hypothetical protein